MSTYISLDNLARYDMKAKARAEGLYADASAACWQKTEKAGAVTCVPSPESPLEPVVEFKFKETPPASGDKSPSNPSTIEGVENIYVARHGNNLCPNTITSKNYNDITIITNSDGSLTFNGTARQNLGLTATVFSFSSAEKWQGILQRNVPYTFSMSGDTGVVFQMYRTTNGTYWGSYAVQIGSGETVTYTIPSNSIGLILRFFVAAGTVLNNATVKMQIDEGSTATAFEPYAGADYTISLPYTFYGGTLDVASGRLTVTHRMVEPSSGTVDISDRPALLPLEYADTYGRTVTSDGNTLSVGSSGGQIVYRLASPYTIQIDPTPIDSLPALGRTSPRVNTVYTDALNVQVGYAEHPAYTEELINNAILALGGNV